MMSVILHWVLFSSGERKLEILHGGKRNWDVTFVASFV
jgi:hypothetical protein